MVRLDQKLLFLLLLLCFLGAALFIGSSFFIKPAIIEITPSNQPKLKENKTISIFLVGDIMLDRGVEYMIEKQGKGDFNFPFLKIADELKGAKLLFGNLEGPISDKGTKVGSIYSFRAKPEAIEGLNFAGFDVLSLSNNHAFDYGREAIEDTILRLTEAGIDTVGLGAPLIKEIKDIKIAFLAYSNSGLPSWGIGWADWENLEETKREIEEAKKMADVLVVSLHAGEEYQKEPTKFQIEFSRAAIDAGADLVVGHHSHVIQPNEKYPSAGSGQAGYIFYGLGNFVFDQGFSEETMKGEILEVLIENGKIKEVIPKEVKINQFFQPLKKNEALPGD